MDPYCRADPILLESGAFDSDREGEVGSLTIGMAARSAGVGVETIRFYERQGLIERPPKDGHSFRRYSEQQIAQIRFIKEAQKLGFSLREAKGLLELWSDPDSDCSEVRARALAKKEEVQGKIDRLLSISMALDRLVADCPRKGALQGCPIIEALAQPAR